MPRTILFLLLLSAALSAVTTCSQVPEMTSASTSIEAAAARLPSPTAPAAQSDSLTFARDFVLPSSIEN